MTTDGALANQPVLQPSQYLVDGYPVAPWRLTGQVQAQIMAIYRAVRSSERELPKEVSLERWDDEDTTYCGLHFGGRKTMTDLRTGRTMTYPDGFTKNNAFVIELP